MIHLLVVFGSDAPMGPLDQYMGFLMAREALLGRKVDLVEVSAIRNPYLRQAVEENKVLLYAA